MLLDILQIGNPLLRMTAKDIENFDDTLKNTIEDMMATLHASGGIGLAAPQVGISEQLFIIHTKSTANYPDLEERWPLAIINPTIISMSDDVHEDREGCLSVPSLRALVSRSSEIEVSYFTAGWEQIHQTLTGMIARVFQHEYDHLHGVFFLDRVTDRESVCTYEERQKRKEWAV